jgi:hypothetical protein
MLQQQGAPSYETVKSARKCPLVVGAMMAQIMVWDLAWMGAGLDLLFTMTHPLLLFRTCAPILGILLIAHVSTLEIS